MAQNSIMKEAFNCLSIVCINREDDAHQDLDANPPLLVFCHWGLLKGDCNPKSSLYKLVLEHVHLPHHLSLLHSVSIDRLNLLGSQSNALQPGEFVSQ